MSVHDVVINVNPIRGRVGTIRGSVSPYGFFHYGKEFFDTAMVSQQSAHFSPVPYYLFCHAIELLLKAFLLAKGIPQKNLPKRYGHDLEKILRKANELGLAEIVPITQEQDREIVRANKYYSSKGFEYFRTFNAARAYPELPDLSVLKRVASTLTKLEPICLNAD